MPDHRETLRSLVRYQELESALNKGELVVHYQPIVELRSGKILGAEALVRWQHPERGLIAPLDFLPVAVECGLIDRIEEYVLRTACEQLMVWQHAYPATPELAMSVNVAAGELSRGALVDRVIRCLGNVEIITCDMNDFDITPCRFDRVVSVEMFEHMKNWPRLMANIARWLKPGGLFFAHVFVHAKFAYHFEARDESDWMSRYFFTGGMMPSHDLFTRFQDDLKLAESWKVNGTDYAKTAEHWLQNMDAHRTEIMPLFAETYGARDAVKWWAYWRVFYLACAELWNFRDGGEWHVSHYLFRKP